MSAPLGARGGSLRALEERARELLELPAAAALELDRLSLGEGREVFRFRTGSGAAAARALVCKRYPDSSGARAHQVHEWLAAALPAGGLHTLRAPRALAFDRESRALWLEALPGRPLDGAGALAAAGSASRLAGRALAELHALPPPAEPVRGLLDHVRELVRPEPGALAAALPEAAPLVARAVAAMSRWDAELRSAPATPLHRDFQLRQLLPDAGRIGVLDWDDFAVGDPAFDLAYFQVYLRNHLEAPRSAALEAEFRAGYLETGGSDPGERLAPYLSFNFLRRASRRLRLKDAGWQRELSRMLRELEASLPG